MSVELISVEELKEEEKKFISVKLDSDRVKFDCPSDLDFVELCQDSCERCWVYSLKNEFGFGTYQSFGELLGFIKRNQVSTIRLNREGVFVEVIFFVNGKAYSQKLVIEDKESIVDKLNSFIQTTIDEIKY